MKTVASDRVSASLKEVEADEIDGYRALILDIFGGEDAALRFCEALRAEPDAKLRLGDFIMDAAELPY